MNWIDLQRVHQLMLDAYTVHNMKVILRLRFDLDVDDLIGDTVGRVQVFTAVLNEFRNRGLVPQLIAELAEERPHREDIQALFRDMAIGLVSEAKRAQVDAAVAAAYLKLGLAPLVASQRSGAAGKDISLSDPGLEKLIRTDLGFLDVALWRERLFKLEGRVCRVELNDQAGIKGTGFLVGPDTLLTNYHVLRKVIEGQHGATAVRFRFDHKVLPNGQIAAGILVGLSTPEDMTRPWLLGHGKLSAAEDSGSPDAAPPAAGELDYALVRLARRLGDEPAGPSGPCRGWIELPSPPPPLAGLTGAVMILQHPRGGPLKLAFDTQPNIELKHGGLRVRYATNTEPGSSGSPVFDKDWKLVALHHYGDPAFPQPRYNQGVPVGLIREHLSDTAKAALGGES
ncbi:trypsin-like peptidase domain-containing protein [bacterium]|nr:trypsin-like peptidase domain-containing protein [bacterium]